MKIPNIKFNNMLPSHDIKQYVSQALGQLAELSPSDAYIGMNMESDENGFWATIKIASHEIVFIDTQFARSPFAAMDNVIGKAKDKIFDWCFNRHLPAEA